METKNIDITGYVYSMFQNLYKAKVSSNPSFVLDENTIREMLNKIIEMVEEPKIKIDYDRLVKLVKTQYEVTQEEGCAILGDYEHDYGWYKKRLESINEENSYRHNYKDYLFNNKKFAPKVVDTIDHDMNEVMSYIRDPNDQAAYDSRGLVVGDVQSGKTANYIGLITKAADAGYRVFFVLTGTIESLRRQTQIRIEEGFTGYDDANGEEVGVGRIEGKIVNCGTNRQSDFVKNNSSTSGYGIGNNVVIYVIKKNVTVLGKIFSSLKNSNTTHKEQRIDAPCLIIDDEADNASINTNKPEDDPTKVNKRIRKILGLFTRTAYVGFTATPFANVFISYDDNDEMLKNDLFPRDFIYALYSPSIYCGADTYFEDDNENVEFIEENSDKIFPLNHKKIFEPTKYDFPRSFYEAINCFFLINTIRDIRDEKKNTHRSMLINMSRFTDVQFCINEVVKDYVGTLKRDIKQCSKRYNDSFNNKSIQSLKNTYETSFKFVNIEWRIIFDHLFYSTKDIQTCVVNSSKKSKKLDYDSYKNTGLRIIAIGGLALSRGLTLEGLCVSYFYRNSTTYDVLMQMGRWFGYRNDYADLCKIFLTKKSRSYYVTINNTIKELKNDIAKMSFEKKKPTDYGIRVRRESLDLNITSANKMRGTKTVVDRKSFYGSLFETPFLLRDLSVNDKNIDNAYKLFNNISLEQKDNNVKHVYFRKISSNVVLEFLNNVMFNNDSDRFNTKSITNFISKHKLDMSYFDVLLMGGDSTKKFVYWDGKVSINLVLRRYDIPNNTMIRMNGIHARLWGKTDTKNGLNEEQLKKYNLSDASKAEDYLIKERDPLLIFYFIDPWKYASTDDDYMSSEDKLNEATFKSDLEKRKYPFLLGLAIGFPKKEDVKDEKDAMYVVNRSQNYYEKLNENDEVSEE